MSASMALGWFEDGIEAGEEVAADQTGGGGLLPGDMVDSVESGRFGSDRSDADTDPNTAGSEFGNTRLLLVGLALAVLLLIGGRRWAA